MIEKETIQLSYTNEKINDGLDEWIAYVESHSQVMISNEYIQASLSAEDNLDFLFLRNRIKSYLLNMSTSRIDSIIYIDNAGRIFNSNDIDPFKGANGFNE